MYEQFYGLRERPFDLTPNPRYLFLTARYREALGNLIYGLAGRKGLTVLTGEAGTGKTTLLSVALAQWRDAGHLVATLRNPTMERPEFLQFLSQEFGLSDGAAASKTTLLREFDALLRQRHADGLLTALVIDEAHSLPTELLEEIRLLANIETADTKLLQLVLLGQPELADRLNDPSLRQLKQRVALRSALMPLNLRETAAYVAKRIQLAGGESVTLFTREAVEAMHYGSNGIPRLINVIADNALVNGFASEQRPVGQDIVRDVCADFDLPVARLAPAASTAIPDGSPAAVAVAQARPTTVASPASVLHDAGTAPSLATEARQAATVPAAPVRQPMVASPSGGLLGGGRIVPIGVTGHHEVDEQHDEPAWGLFRWLRRTLNMFKTRDRA